MNHGRHRRPSSLSTMLPPAAVGALAGCGAVLALLGADLRVLRLATLMSAGALVALLALQVTSERGHRRRLALEASHRRLDRAALQEQIDALVTVVDRLDTQVHALLATTTAEAGRVEPDEPDEDLVDLTVHDDTEQIELPTKLPSQLRRHA